MVGALLGFPHHLHGDILLMCTWRLQWVICSACPQTDIKILDPPKVSWHLMFHTGRLEKQTNKQTNRQTKKTNIHTFNEQLTSEIKRLCPKLGGQKQQRWLSLLFDWGVRWRVFFHCMDCTYSFMMYIYIYTCLHIKLYICVCECVCNYIYNVPTCIYTYIYIYYNYIYIYQTIVIHRRREALSTIYYI